jgi:hypothetical protein
MSGLEFGSAGALVGWAFQIECTAICTSSRIGKTEAGRCPDLSPHDAHAQAAMVMAVVNRLEFGPRLALWTLYHGGDAHIIAAAELVSAVFDRDIPRAALREACGIGLAMMAPRPPPGWASLQACRNGLAIASGSR